MFMIYFLSMANQMQVALGGGGGRVAYVVP